jgi:hypothetical protein
VPFFLNRDGLLQRLAERPARNRNVAHVFSRVDACRHDRHTHHAGHVRIQGGAYDNVGVRIDFLANAVRGLVELEER